MAWSSIRHDTEIGADAQGQATQVRFFSIYLHLHTMAPTIRAGRPIWRKDAIGQAGYIYGVPNRIHFEIVCDDANLQRLVGRAQGELNTAADGRGDAVYGEMYFGLPTGTPVFGQQPLLNRAQAMTQAPAPRGQPAPAPQPLQAVHTTAEAFFVGLRYAGGEGVAGNRGDAYVSTYRADGSALGAPLEDNDAEYNLYASATNISYAYPANARPAPSAVYELLRFGRLIGPDALNPADVPHWRQVRYPGGQGWVNLNAANVRKFRDADFPHWKNWRLIDDSGDRDSRCDSAIIRAWLDTNADGRVVPAEASARLSEAGITPKLARALCKFPTEWEAATIDARWGWLKTRTEENPDPLEEADFACLRAHIEALCFWQQANLGIAASHWHFQPREFVRQFRRCGWLSLSETLLCLPSGHGVLSFANMRTRFTQGVASPRQVFPAGMYEALNRARHKYAIFGARRTAHFFGQVCVETDRLQTVCEYASGNAYEMSVDAAKAAELGNTQPGDGPRFKGRGVIQVTGRANYRAYGAYRGRDYTQEPNNLLLQNEAYTASDCSTHYWALRRFSTVERDG